MRYAMPYAARSVLDGALVVATAVWLGGFLAIFIVARVAAATLGARERVAFFRALGRRYGAIGGAALVVGLGAGAALLAGRPWSGAATAAAVVAALLVAATVAGVAQARRMTRLRRDLLDQAGGPLAGRVRRQARLAVVLRSLIGGLSLILVALGVLLAS